MRKTGSRHGENGRIDYVTEVLRRAERLCDDALAERSDQPALLHLYGLLLSRQRGHGAAALACLQRAAGLSPNRCVYNLSLSEALARSGRTRPALAALLKALTLAPRSTELYLRLGALLLRLRHLLEAAASYALAQQGANGIPAAFIGLGDVCRAQGRLREAVHFYRKALQLAPDSAAGHRGLGRTWLALKRPRKAFERFSCGAKRNPGCVGLMILEGEASLALGANADAVERFEYALTQDVYNIRASRLLVQAWEHEARAAELIMAWHHLGQAYQMHLRYEEAAAAFLRAHDAGPEVLPPVASLGHTYLACGRPHDAFPWICRAVDRAPDDRAARIDLATFYHLVGDLELGWKEFAFYYDPQHFRRLGLECPLWDGSPLNGRTILLWPEMGRGDSIDSLRFVPAITRLGGRVVIRCNYPALAPLMKTIPGVEDVAMPGTPLSHVDVHAPLLFFPAIVNLRQSFRPDDVPYLQADAALVASWRRRLGSRSNKLVGLSWGGNTVTVSAPSRFISLSLLSPLGDVGDVEFVSLQHGAQSAELFSSVGMRVEQLFTRSSSIADAAAVIANLDLVITVDTMIAHLAGAMGKPVWMLVRYATNWRWQHRGERTPWYPTMRLFRQSRLGDWRDAVVQLRTALDVFAG